MAECVRCGEETDLVESGLPVCMNCIDQAPGYQPPEPKPPAKEDKKPADPSR